MKRILALLAAALVGFGPAVAEPASGLQPCAALWDLFSAFGSQRQAWVVGTDIDFADITDFYYTYDASTNPPFFQRYRLYVEDGRTLFYHETRENGGWPQTEEDITVSGTVELSEAQVEAFRACLEGGTVRPREESLDTGDAGPWLFLYWTGDRGENQAFTFPSWEAQTRFEALCADLRGEK